MHNLILIHALSSSYRNVSDMQANMHIVQNVVEFGGGECRQGIALSVTFFLGEEGVSKA